MALNEAISCSFIFFKSSDIPLLTIFYHHVLVCSHSQQFLLLPQSLVISVVPIIPGNYLCSLLWATSCPGNYFCSFVLGILIHFRASACLQSPQCAYHIPISDSLVVFPCNFCSFLTNVVFHSLKSLMFTTQTLPRVSISQRLLESAYIPTQLLSILSNLSEHLYVHQDKSGRNQKFHMSGVSWILHHHRQEEDPATPPPISHKAQQQLNQFDSWHNFQQYKPPKFG